MVALAKAALAELKARVMLLETLEQLSQVEFVVSGVPARH